MQGRGGAQRLEAAEQPEAVRAGEASAVEMVECTIDRTEVLNPVVSSVALPRFV